MTSQYTALAAVYDRWTADNDYRRWTDFVVANLPDQPGPILDLCCGTGAMTRLLAARGYEVTGVDRSEDMLAIARASIPGSTFILGELPGAYLGPDTHYAAAICTFDSLNYLPAVENMERLFRCVHNALQPGGVFIFDLNTQHKLQDVFGNGHYGDDLDDFAYVWRNRTDATAHTTTFEITLFTRQGTSWRRETEHHLQRWFTDDEVAATASSAGFRHTSTTDDYTREPVGTATLRQTWVMHRPQ